MRKFFWRHPGWSVFLIFAFVVMIFSCFMSIPIIVASSVAFVLWLILAIVLIEIQSKFITFVPVGESGRVIKVVDGKIVKEAQCVWGREGKENGIYRVPQLNLDDRWKYRVFDFVLIFQNGSFERMEIPINITIKSSNGQFNAQEVYDHIIKPGYKDFDEFIKEIIFKKDVIEVARRHMSRFLNDYITYKEYVRGVTDRFFEDEPQELIKKSFSIFEEVEIIIDFEHQRYISRAVSS